MKDKNLLSKLLLASATQFSNQTAIKGNNGDISYSVLKKLATNLALHLHNRGVRQGSLVAIENNNTKVSEIISILSLTLLGCTWIVFDKKYLKGETIKMNFVIASKSSKLSGKRIIHISKNNFLKRPKNFQSKKKVHFTGYASVDDPWYIATSSGTTGEPKLMPITSQMFYERIIRYQEYDNTEENLVFFDLFRQTSNLANLHFFFTIAHGGTYLLYNSLDKLINGKVKYVVGSPMHFSQLLQDIPIGKYPLIKEARIVGSALNEQLLERLLNYFETVRVSYGSTEAGQVTTKLLEQYTTDKSIGKVYDGVDLEIVDENGTPVNDNVEGSVRIKTSSQIKGYLNEEEATSESFKNGWFYPGDRGYYSSEKELYIVGREKDHLNIGGVKVNAALVDELLQKSEGIEDAISFSQPAESGIDELSALVMLEKDHDPEKVVLGIAKYFNRQLPRMRNMLKNIYISKTIPRNTNGKVMRHKVNEIVEGEKPVKLKYPRQQKLNQQKRVQKR